MAVLQAPVSSGSDLGPVPPAGTFHAVCYDIQDRFAVQRKKFQSEEMETVDLTRFFFEFDGGDGQLYKVASRPMKISGHEKSGLYQFLRSWIGKAPVMGWDYCEMVGHEAIITIELQPSRDGSREFPNIINVSPVVQAPPPPRKQAPAPAAKPAAPVAAKPPAARPAARPVQKPMAPPPVEEAAAADDVIPF